LTCLSAGRIFLQSACPNLRTLRAVNALIGSYYANYLAGTPIAENWPERAADQVLEGLIRADNN
jgi:hypothetical protein